PVPPHLLIVGDAEAQPALDAWGGNEDIASRVHTTGYVADEALGEYLSASDVCLCLRWPTALETSAAWLRCLAAGKPTVISDLAHLVDIPTIEARTWQPTHAGQAPVAVTVDLVDEDTALFEAMSRLMADPALRATLAAAGQQHWSDQHTLD